MQLHNNRTHNLNNNCKTTKTRDQQKKTNTPFRKGNEHEPIISRSDNTDSIDSIRQQPREEDDSHNGPTRPPTVTIPLALPAPIGPTIINTTTTPTFIDKETISAYISLKEMARKENDQCYTQKDGEIEKRRILGRIFTNNLTNHQRQALGHEKVTNINLGQYTANQITDIMRNTDDIQEHQQTPTLPSDKTFVMDHPNIPAWTRNEENLRVFNTLEITRMTSP